MNSKPEDFDCENIGELVVNILSEIEFEVTERAHDFGRVRYLNTIEPHISSIVDPLFVIVE